MEKLVYSVKEKKIPVVELDGRKIILKQALNDLQENIILKESR